MYFFFFFFFFFLHIEKVLVKGKAKLLEFVTFKISKMFLFIIDYVGYHRYYTYL